MAERVKILYILDHFYSGGTQKNIKDFLELCDRGKFDVTLYSLFGGNAYFEASDPDLRRKTCLFNRRFSLWRYALAAPYIIYRLARFISRGGFDIVHIRLYAAFPVGVIAARLAGARHVLYTIEASREQLPFYCFPIFRLFSGFVEYFLSYYQREYLEAGLPEEKFRPYEGGINLQKVDSVSYDKEEVRRRHGLEGRYPVLLSVGRLFPDKGHQYAISALEHLIARYPYIKLVILGEGLYEPHLRRLADQKGLADHVWFAGFHNDIGEFHTIADICLKAAINEPTNLAAMLGMAYGNPVVAFDTGFEVDIIEHMETGYLARNRDPEALARGVTEVLERPGLKARLSNSGKALVFSRYDIRGVFRRYEDFYLQVCNG